MKAAEEIDLSIESHTEEVETENTVLVKNSIAFECDECSYRNNSEKGLHKHKRMKHRISQTDGADDHEVNEPEIPVKSAGERKYPAYGGQSISRLMRIVAPIPKKCFEKYITCHLSPVTCHLSGVMCHMSCVTCHMSYVTCIFYTFFFTKW